MSILEALYTPKRERTRSVAKLGSRKFSWSARKASKHSPRKVTSTENSSKNEIIVEADSDNESEPEQPPKPKIKSHASGKSLRVRTKQKRSFGERLQNSALKSRLNLKVH